MFNKRYQLKPKKIIKNYTLYENLNDLLIEVVEKVVEVCLNDILVKNFKKNNIKNK